MTNEMSDCAKAEEGMSTAKIVEALMVVRQNSAESGRCGSGKYCPMSDCTNGTSIKLVI
jgi:hypothetical protein